MFSSYQCQCIVIFFLILQNIMNCFLTIHVTEVEEKEITISVENAQTNEV